MAERIVRHLMGLVKDVLVSGGVPNVLKQALEAALAGIMEGEVGEIVGAAHGERSSERSTYRNGYRARPFDTAVGTIDVQVPKLRDGSYFPSFLKARQRSDEALVMALTECYVQGVSTRRAEQIAQALGVDQISKSTVSRLVERLDPQIKAFRERGLPECAYVYVDARYEFVREDHRIRKMAVLVALGIRYDGAREVLGYAVAPVESEAYWGDFLRDLKRRGLTGVRLVISDAHEGLRKAIAQVFPSAEWQRCKVHFLRNMAARMPKKKRPALLALLKTIFAQDSLEQARDQRRSVADVLHKAGLVEAATALEEADEVLTYMKFPLDHWTKLNSTNVLERLNRELKRRTRLVSIFPNRDAVVRLAGALLLEEQDEWLVGRRFISEESMKSLQSAAQQLDEITPGAGALLDG